MRFCRDCLAADGFGEASTAHQCMYGAGVAGTPEGQQFMTSSIRTFVCEGTKVYMDKLEGTNTWADLLAAINQGRNGDAMDRMTRVFVRELVHSYFRRPSGNRYVI
jgi:hypothetical protein